MTCSHYLFYISQNYSFEILRPLQKIIWQQGGKVLWFVDGNDVNFDNFTREEIVTTDPVHAVEFSPKATYVPGNVVPGFIPGLKIQVFHGLEWKKKGHFGMRGCFDLYCTHGPATTLRFEQLAKQYGHFDVIETGWPKLDGLFTSESYQWAEQTSQKIVLFAPTFSPALTAAPALFEQISRLVAEKDWQWLVKFHPKMDQTWIDKYKALDLDNLKVVQDSDVAHLLQVADVMVSDTSSIIGEFSLLGKPAVTLNNSQPGPYLIDIAHADQLEEAIEQAFASTPTMKEHISDYAQDLHPYNDGLSAQRILDATNHMLENGRAHLKSKPLNLFRNLKMRRKLSYWKF